MFVLLFVLILVVVVVVVVGGEEWRILLPIYGKYLFFIWNRLHIDSKGVLF